MAKRNIRDPIEQIIAKALEQAGIGFIHESEGHQPPLDFYLPQQDIYIEVKQYHSDRIARQMAQADNVIVIQGRRAAQAFASMINAGIMIKSS